MDGHNASTQKQYIQNHCGEAVYIKNAISSSRVNVNRMNNFCQKQKQGKNKNGRARSSSKAQKGRNPNNDESIELFDCFDQRMDEDSDYEFSEQIMQKSTKRQSRRSREQEKLVHLQLFDWMMKISALLKLRKQTVYRAIITLKKFIFLEQKLIHSKVTIENANLYALASLLIANKLENIDGNFLHKVHHLTQAGLAHSQKQAVLECQIYILTVLKFRINEKIRLIETLMDTIHIWNSIIKNTALSTYTFSPYDRIIEFMHKKPAEGKQDEVLLQIFMFLMDFVMIRKIIELRIKDMSIMEDPAFYKRAIINILYHLVYFLIGQSNRELKMAEEKAIRSVFHLFANKLLFQKSDHSVLFRKSHLLSKQIRALFSNRLSPHLSTIKNIASMHKRLQSQHCVCNIGNISKKYLDAQELLRKQKQYEQLFVYQPQIEQKLKEQYETDMMVQELVKPKKTNNIKIPSIQCAKCLKDERLLSEIMNKQFYVPTYFNRTK